MRGGTAPPRDFFGQWFEKLRVPWWIKPIDTARDILVGASPVLQKRRHLPNNSKQPYGLDQD